MALTVGELVGYLRLDGQQFDRQLDDSGRKFQGLGQAIGSGSKVMATAVVGVATATLGLGAAAVKVGLDYNRLQQTSRAALTTLLGGAEAANAQMDKLDDFARNSPFAKQVFIQAQQQLLGFGVEAEKVIPILDAIQNGVAAVGGSNDDISELVRVIAQVQSSGKITAETLNQLGARGVDAATLIGSQMGKTGAQIREEITKGSLGAEEAIDALTTGMMERFGGATDNIKLQMDGAADRVKGAFRDIGSVLAAPFIDPNGGGYLVTWTNDVADGMRAFQRQLAPVVDTLVRRFGPGLERISPNLQLVVRTIDQWDLSRVNTQLDRLTGYTPLIVGASAALFAYGTSNLPILSSLGLTGINPVVAGIAALVAASPELRGAAGDFLTALSPLVPVGQELAGVTAGAAMAMLDDLAPALRDLLLAAAPLIVSLGEGLAPALILAVEAAVPMVGVAADLLSLVAQIPEPVLAVALALGAMHAASGPAQDGLSLVTTGFKMLQERMELQRALAAMSNTSLTNMGAAAAVARTEVSGLGNALKTSFLTNPITLVIGGLAAIFGVWYKEVSESRDRVDALANSLDDLTGAATENTREIAANQLQQVGALESARDLGLAHGVLTDAMLGNEAAQAKVARAIDRVREAEMAAAADTTLYNDALVQQGDAANTVERALSVYVPEVEAARQKNAELSGELGESARAMDESTSAAERAEASMRDLDAALQDLNNEAIDSEQAQIRFKDAVDRATEAAAESTAGLDINTREGRLNREALLGIARAAMDNALAIGESTGSQKSFETALQTGREELKRVARQFGMTEEQADAYADQVLAIPDKATTTVAFDDAAALRRIEAFKRALAMPAVVISPEMRSSNPYYSNRANGGWAGPQAPTAFANGSLVQAANGVKREPMIAKGGANILWAEPETGWEAYISGKPGMRARNVGILAEAADRFGYMVMPKGVTGHADGAMRGAAPATTPTTAGPLIGNLTVNGQDADAVANSVGDVITRALWTREHGSLYARGAP